MSKAPRGFRLANTFIDIILKPVSWLLFPFYLLTTARKIFGRSIWLLSNEYRKRSFGHCGRGVRIHGRFRITAPKNFIVDDNVHINENAFLRAEGGLHIGANTHISRNLVIYTMNHQYEGEYLPYDAQKVLKPVEIGRNVWIGMNVTITPGVTIGDGAIIGMGTVVAKDVPPLAIVGSAPQQIIKTRDKTHYQTLDSAAKYGGMSGHPWADASDE